MNFEILSFIQTGQIEYAKLLIKNTVLTEFEKNLLLGIIEFRLGNFRESQKLCQNVIESTDDFLLLLFAEIFLYRSMMYCDQNNSIFLEFERIEKQISVIKNEFNKNKLLIILFRGVGECLIEFSKFDKALTYLDRSDAMLSRGDEIDRSLTDLVRAQVYTHKGDLESAVKIVRRLKNKFSKFEDQYSLSVLHNIQGIIYSKRGDYRNSKQELYKVIELNRENSNDYELVKTYNILSILTNYQGNIQEANNYTNYARNLAVSNGYKRLEIIALNNKARILFYEGKYQQAIQDFTEILTYMIKVNDLEYVKLILISVGASYSRLGSFELALDYYHQCLELEKTSKNDGKHIQLLLNISGIYDRLGKYEQAKTILANAIHLNGTYLSNQFEANINLNLGKVHLHKGEYERAANYLLKSEDLYYEMEDIFMYTTVKYHRSSLNLILGNYQEALRNLRECLNLITPMNNVDQISRILLLNFQIYIEILRFDKARKIVEELKKIKPKGIESDIKTRITLAENLLNQHIMGTPDKAKIEQTYKHILSKKLVDKEFYTFALIHLIEFLITEVFVNDDDKYFIEIEKYLYQLYELMTNNGSHYMRCQTLFLQYKISMARTDLLSANLYLDQAHEVAAEYGYSSKLNEIALENLKLSQLLTMEN